MRRRFAFSLVLGLAASACSSSPADGAKPGQDAAADAPSEASFDSGPDVSNDAAACKLLGPYSSSNASCNDCAEASCCIEVNACFGDPDCNDGYVNCILACALAPDDAGDAAVEQCLGDCAAQWPKGKSEYDSAITCAESKCQSCK